MADIDIERFAPSPDPELICPICHSVLHQPYETPCQHVFCKDCILTWIRRGRGAFADRGNKCPSCRDYVYHDELKPALTILCNLINKLKVKCINQGAGCKEVVSKEYLEAHEKECEYQEVACTNAGCLVKSLRRNHQKHAESCTMRLVQCTKECQLRMRQYLLSTHSCLKDLKQELKERYLEVAVLKEIIETRVPVVSTSLRSEINWISGDVSFNRAMTLSNYREENQNPRASERQMLDKLVSGVDPRTHPAPPHNDNHTDSDRSPATTDEPHRSPAYSIQSPSDHGGSPVYVGPPDSPPQPDYIDYQFDYNDDNDNYITDEHGSSNNSTYEDADITHNNSDVDIMSEDNSDSDDNRSRHTSDDDDNDDQDNDYDNDHDNDQNEEPDDDHHTDDAGSDDDNSNADDSNNGNDCGNGRDDNDRYSDDYSPDDHSDYEDGNGNGRNQTSPSYSDSSDDGDYVSDRRHHTRRSIHVLLESDTDPLEGDDEDTSFEGNMDDNSFQVSSTSSQGSVRSPFSTRREPNIEDDESMNEQFQPPANGGNSRNISPHQTTDDDADDDDDEDDDEDEDDANIDGDDKNGSENSDEEPSDTSTSDRTGHTSDDDRAPVQIKQELVDRIQIELSSEEEGEGHTSTDKYSNKFKSGSDKKNGSDKSNGEESLESEAECSRSVIAVSDDDDDDDDLQSHREGTSGAINKSDNLANVKHDVKDSQNGRSQGSKIDVSEDTMLSRKQAEYVIHVNGTSSDDDNDDDAHSDDSHSLSSDDNDDDGDDRQVKSGTLKLKRQLSNSSDEFDAIYSRGNTVRVNNETRHVMSNKDSPSSPEGSEDDEPETTCIKTSVLSENECSHTKRSRESSPETSHFSEGSFEPDYTETESGEEDGGIGRTNTVKVRRSKHGTSKKLRTNCSQDEDKNDGVRSQEVPKKCSVGDSALPDCVPQQNMSQKLAKDISMLIKKTSGVKRTLMSPPRKGDAKKRKLVTVTVPMKSPHC